MVTKRIWENNNMLQNFRIFWPFLYLLPPTGTNLDLSCIQQSDAALFYEIYAKFNFDAKHLKKGLNKEWWNFRCPFLLQKILFLSLSDIALFS